MDIYIYVFCVYVYVHVYMWKHDWVVEIIAARTQTYGAYANIAHGCIILGTITNLH